MRKLLAFLIFLLSLTEASFKTKVLQLRTVQDFIKGEGENVAFFQDRGITFAPPVDKVLDSPEAFLWSMAISPSGEIYLGTGQRGLLLILDKAFQIKQQVVLPEVNITTLLPTRWGVYAAGFPSGKVFSVTSSGKVRELADLEATYIWQLIQDGERLYALTGDPACLVQVQPEVKRIFCARAAHFLSGVKKPDGFYIGAGNPASLYRILPGKEAQVIFSFEGEDLYRIIQNGEELYVAVNGQQALSSKEPGDKTEKQNREVVEQKAQEPSYSRSIFPAPQQKTAISAKVYKLIRGKLPEVILDVGDPVVASLAVRDGFLYVGTGNEGRLYLRGLRDAQALAFSVPSRQVLAILPTDTSIYLVCGNPAALYRVDLSSKQVKMRYLSDLIDAKTPSIPGRIGFKGNLPSAKVWVRAGNTPIPDDTWTKWSDSLEENQIAYRFFQLKVEAEGKWNHGKISELFFFFRPLNRPPQILSLDLQSKPSTAPEKPEKGVPYSKGRKLLINAKDPDGDPLQFDIYLLREDGRRLLLARKRTQPSYDLDFKKLPEGRYSVEVVASDALANAPEETLQDRLSTHLFYIDLTPPEISYRIGKEKLKIKVEENLSFVSSVTLRQGKKVIPILPQDKVYDEKMEEFSIPLTSLTFPLVIKATDANGNMTTVWVENE